MPRASELLQVDRTGGRPPHASIVTIGSDQSIASAVASSDFQRCVVRRIALESAGGVTGALPIEGSKENGARRNYCARVLLRHGETGVERTR